MTTRLKTKPCAACDGTGAVPGDNVGEVLRSEREKAGVTRTALADAMNVSLTFLYDLESDNRRWTSELVSSYQKALAKLVRTKERVEAL